MQNDQTENSTEWTERARDREGQRDVRVLVCVCVCARMAKPPTPSEHQCLVLMADGNDNHPLVQT